MNGAVMPTFTSRSLDYCSINFLVYNNDWRDNLYTNAEPIDDVMFGTLTGHGTLDFYSWSTEGMVYPSGSEIWEQCMTLFMRHI
jgi:hypothetical protein